MVDANTTTGTGDGSDEELRKQIDALKKDFAELTDTVRQQARRRMDQAEERATEKMEDVEDQIRQNPIAATAIAAGIGFLLGAILSR